jgi:hypothetical protein
MERTARLLELLRALARRGLAAARPTPGRRRLVLLQIDGLSSKRLERALARGDLPHLAARIGSGALALKRLLTATAPSTPVHQAGLLYGTTGGIPGFGWRDPALGRTVRMDLADDVAAIERELSDGGESLLDGGVSYGTIFEGAAGDAFFNLIRWSRFGGAPPPPRNAWDRLASLATFAVALARMSTRIAGEGAVAARDLLRLVGEQRPTRFEWRFLFFRLLFGVILRDVAAHGAVLDLLRGVPIVFANFVAYDEIAHRRGPDHPAALHHLSAIDDAIAQVHAAADAVPEYGYEVFVVSDHGQSATAPFERLIGEDPAEWMTRRLLGDGPGAARLARALARVRRFRFRAHAWPRPFGALAGPWIRELERGVERRLAQALPGAPLAVHVVTGGTIAHVYLRRRGAPLTLEEIERRWPEAVRRLADCPGVGFLVVRGRRGPVVFHRGRRIALHRGRLPPFACDGDLLAHHLTAAVTSPRAGDLVAFGAFAPAGNVAFDFEYGSHGGVHPDELDCFLLHPTSVPVPAWRRVCADELHRFFRARYRAG